MDFRNANRPILRASAGLVPILFDLPILIRLGELSAWIQFGAELLSLCILVAAVLYLAFADRRLFLAKQHPERIAPYQYTAITAIVVTNILTAYVVKSLLLELKYGSWPIFHAVNVVNGSR